MVTEPVMSFYFHGILREKHFKTCPISKILLRKAGSHKAVFQHAQFRFCGIVWQFYEDSINSQLSAGSGSLNTRGARLGSQRPAWARCASQSPRLQPQQSCPAPPSLGGKQVGSQDLYQAVVTSRRPQTAPSRW